MFDTMPPLNALRSFVLVAKHGSLAAAAGLQNVTQPAVSKRIRVLERHFGVQLFVRGANTVTLTPVGQRYVEKIAKAFSDIEAATLELRKESAGPLRIRCYTTWATRWLIPRLPRFKAEYPDCDIEIRTSVEPVDFSRDDVAAAVSSAAEDPPSPYAGRLQAIQVAPFATPERAAAFNGEWQNVTRLGSENRPRDWTWWMEQTQTDVRGPLLMFETTALAIELALRGMGVVITSDFMVADEVREGRLVQIGPLAETGSRYWLTLPPNATHRRETILFRDWLVAEVGKEEAARARIAAEFASARALEPAR